MAHDAGFEMASEQLFRGWNEAANSDDPYDSDNHRIAPKNSNDEVDAKLSAPPPPGS